MSIREFFHSSVKYAFAYTDVQISSAVLKDEGLDPDVRLGVSKGSDSANIPMQVYGIQSVGGQEYTVYSAVIPSSMVGESGTLEYSITVDGEEKAHSTLNVKPKMLPEIIITELYVRPRGLMASQYIELTNISDHDVDLYNYKLMYHSGFSRSPEAPIMENMFSASEGECILRSHESAVVRFLTPTVHKVEGGTLADSDGFCRIMNSEYGYGDLCLSADKVKIFNPEISEKSDADVWELKPRAFELPNTLKKHTFLIVPRSGSFDDAVFKLCCNGNGDKFEWDYPVKASSLWNVSVEDPTNAVRVTHRSRVSPGYLEESQLIPDFKDIFPPLIIPDVSHNSAYYSDGDINIEFAVVDKSKFNASLTYIDENSEKKTVYASESSGKGLFSVCVPVEKLKKLKRFDYYITASDSVRTVQCGSASEPLVINLYDNIGPELESIFPSDRSVYEFEDGNGRVTVSGKYFDVSGVNLSKCIFCLDKKNYSSKTQWGADGFTFTSGKLKKGRHTVELALFDLLGNVSYHKSVFRLESNKMLGAYHGEVHSHTSVSDGCGTTADALTYARDVGKVDFFAVTDHSHYFSDAEYREQIEVADEFDDPGHFTALYGYEMTWNMNNGFWGHMNVINSNTIVHDIDKVSMPDMFEIIKNDPDAIAMFNHPGYNWGNFNEFAYYSPEIDEKICLSEVKGQKHDREYANLLAKGWHATPSFNEDNHLPNWTCETSSTTYVLSPALTRYNILDSIKKRRTYTTTDPTMKLYFKINDKWLGSTLKDPETLNVYLKVFTEDESGIGTISLVGEDNIVVSSVNVGLRRSYVWKLTVPTEYDYYYIKITSAGKYTATAPVWIEGHKGIKISEIRSGLSAFVERPNGIVAKIANTSDGVIENIRVDFYVTNVSGFDHERTEPYYTTYVKKMTAGETLELNAAAPNIRGYRRLSVTARGFTGKKIRTSDTAFIMLTPVVIAGILPSSSSYTEIKEDGSSVEHVNPFPYITLYNTTHSELKLDNYLLRNWIKTGKVPLEGSSSKLTGMVIKPHSSIVIWVKHNSPELTAAQFNERYGTSFVEGEGFYSVTSKLVDKGHDSHRLELFEYDEMISRARYNYGLGVINGDITVDKEITFRYIPNMTGTLEILSNDEAHAPGTVETAQKPSSVFGGISVSEPHSSKKVERAFKKASKGSDKRSCSRPSGVKTSIGMLGAAALGATVAALTIKLVGKSSERSGKGSAKASDETGIKQTSSLVLPLAGAIASLLPGKTRTKTGVKVKETGRSLKTVTKTVTTTTAKKSDIVKKNDAVTHQKSKKSSKSKQNKKSAARTVAQVKKEIKKAAAQNKKGIVVKIPQTAAEKELK